MANLDYEFEQLQLFIKQNIQSRLFQDVLPTLDFYFLSLTNGAPKRAVNFVVIIDLRMFPLGSRMVLEHQRGI